MFRITADKAWQVAKNKYIEFQLNFNDSFGASIFQLDARIARRTDHAGVMFRLELFELLHLAIEFYDCRHWNYDKGHYYTDAEYIADMTDGDNLTDWDRD